jgi:hypothetical protein
MMFIEQYRRNWIEGIDRMSSDVFPEKIISPKMKRKFGKTSEVMEGFCFLISVTDLSRPKPGKDDDADQ